MSSSILPSLTKKRLSGVSVKVAAGVWIAGVESSIPSHPMVTPRPKNINNIEDFWSRGVYEM